MTQEIAVIDNTAIAQAFATPSGIDVLIQREGLEALLLSWNVEVKEAA